MMRLRPTIRELDKKLAEAKAAIEGGNAVFANIEKSMSELEDLEIFDARKVWPLIKSLLSEIVLDDYSGARSPQRSYEPRVYGKELLAFSWWSRRMRRKMYLKFCMAKGIFYCVSIHESRRER